MICEHCNGKAYARGMCEKLYRRWKRNGSTKPLRRRSLDEIKYLRRHGCVGVPLTRDLYAWIDESDLPLVESFIWSAVQHGHTWYAVSRAGYMHDVLIKPPMGLEVDHCDGNGLWNFRWNLQAVTHQENMKNNRRCLGGHCLQRMSVAGEREREWHELERQLELDRSL